MNLKEFIIELKLLLKSKLVLGVLLVIMFFPVLINFLVLSWRSNLAFGTDWSSFFATYYGAIIGGFISGSLTLIGVILTIKSTSSGINKTIEEQRETREQDILIQTSKDRLLNLYHPVDSLISDFTYKMKGAFYFTDLTEEDQREFINIVNKNIVYADQNFYLNFIELKWALNSRDFKEANKKYYQLSDLITENIIELRDLLKLPKMYIE